MDSHAFASLAHVRILLLPVGSIQHSTFEKFAAEIKDFDDIRLGDIPADQKDERARFMPNPLSTGHLHLSFPSHPPPLTHSYLSLFRPSHFPLGVIGIGVCSQTDSLSSMLDQFNASLLNVFPAGSLFPLAKNCFVFEDSDCTTNLNLGDNLPGLVVIPSMMGNKKLYIGTLLADLCSHILGEFGRVVHTLESPLGNEYLNSTLFPTLPTSSEMPQYLENGTDSLPPLPSHNSQPELGGSTQQSRAQANLNLKRNSSTGPSLGPAGNTNSFRQSTLGIPGAKSKRSSGIGAASSPGRLYKVLADFFLLSGRTEDATVWYTEAIVLFKSQQDAPWHASALEGLATIAVIDAWQTGHGLAGSFSNGQEPWTDISDRLAQATALYYKPTPPTSDMDQNHFFLAYLYCTAVLRQTTLFFSVWSAKGWGPLAFTTMLQPGASPYLPPTLAHSEHNSVLNLERLCSVTGISRATIAGLLAQAHGPWLLHLGPRERLSVLETMAGIYACLGYQRKEAYILREVLGCIMDLLVCGREENRGTSRSSPGTSGAGLGIRGVTFGDRNAGAEQGSVGVRHNDYVEGNDSILRLLKYVCRVLGINLEAVKLVDADFDGQTNMDEDTSSPDSTPPFQPDNDALDLSHDAYGWPELQIGVIREAIAVAESLPDYPTVAQIALSALKTMHPVLATADQYHLYATSTRALTTAQRRGDTKQIEYWAGRPIVSVAISPLPFVRLPIEKPMSILSVRLTDINPILTGATDPFLYNPRRSLSAQGKSLIVQNETLEFVVTLQNPFVFDLELQTLALSTSGVPFEAKSMPVILPANSFHTVSIIGQPLGTGNLVIRGCNVQAPGGMSREFILPLSTDDEEDRLSRRRSAMECEIDRSKYSGLDSRPWERAGKRTSTNIINKNSSRFLECKVVPEQPLLRIRRTSLTHGAVMLYNGEMSTIRLTLENVSTLPIDFLRLSFDDSTIAPAQQALADGNLSVFDTYETEYDLINRPTFLWQSSKEFEEVAPGQKVVLTVVCFGKVGCISGAIHIAYAYVHRPLISGGTPPEVFYTRQLTYPVLVTVYHMLECHGMDVLPFDRTESHDSDEGEETTHSRRTLLSVGDEAGWCLFSIDVRNTYGLPFGVTFERDQAGTPKISTTLVVAPGSTSRIVLPVKKFLLPGEHISQPIPTLSDRQFVVTKSNLTSAEETNQRELFWYREELFKFIRGHWREAGGTRSGSLSLRQQRMTLPMLETIRTETARVKMEFIRYSDDDGSVEDTVVREGGKYMPCPNEFVYLRTEVINLSPFPLILLVDLDIDPMEHVIYNGVLSGIPLGHLEPGESQVLETAVAFLSQGRFEVRAEARILGAPRGERMAGVGVFRADVRDER